MFNCFKYHANTGLVKPNSIRFNQYQEVSYLFSIFHHWKQNHFRSLITCFLFETVRNFPIKKKNFRSIFNFCSKFFAWTNVWDLVAFDFKYKLIILLFIWFEILVHWPQKLFASNRWFLRANTYPVFIHMMNFRDYAKRTKRKESTRIFYRQILNHNKNSINPNCQFAREREREKRLK
jgi:hypothetical protein